jgi:hypothetical protein
MKLINFIILCFIFCSNLMAGPTKVGNGDDGADLEGFELITNGPLIESKNLALHLLMKLNTKGILGLGNLVPELENSKIYMTSKDVSSKKLEEMGAYHSGMEGLIYARTFAHAYAATRFFPAALKLNQNQLMALHIHEALHRALPEKISEDEKIVTKLTLAIISPDQTTDNIQDAVKETIPELFVIHPEVVINKNSKLQSPSFLDISYSKWTSSKRNFSNGFNTPLDHSYNVGAEFYPFGSERAATGFGLNTEYIFTKRNENYFGPLELTIRHLLWTERGYDFEFKAGANLMSASNSKVIDSAFGRDVYILSLTANKVSDFYKIKLEANFQGPSSFTRNFNSLSNHYEIGTLLDINGSILIPYQKFEFGGTANLYSLSSLKVNLDSIELLNKDRDQYFQAGFISKFKYLNYITFYLNADYLFNSNHNASEDYLRDLFGNSMGQWKLTTGASMLFF